MTFKTPVVTLTVFGSLLTHHLGHFASLFRYLQVSFLSLGNLSYFFRHCACRCRRCVVTTHLSQHVFNCPYLLVEEAMAPHSSALAWKIPWDYWGFPNGSAAKNHLQGKRHDFSPWGEHPLEKEMATYSSILAWETPWTEEPGGLQSIGSHRAKHNWAWHTHTHLLGVKLSPQRCVKSLTWGTAESG